MRDLAEKIKLAERICQGQPPMATRMQLVMYAIDIVDAERAGKTYACDFGNVTNWHASTSAVSLTSDLGKAYNNTSLRTPSNAAAKLTSLTREFVVIQRGADGVDRESVFTYDRLEGTAPTVVIPPPVTPTLPASPLTLNLSGHVVSVGPDGVSVSPKV